jgi:tetratricopeptide (TPR) repeat protein
MFLCALLSKPMAVTLPVILLLLDFYPLNRLTVTTTKNLWVLWEKIPFFFLSLFTGIITALAQSAEAIISLERIPLIARLLNALRALVFYLQKIVLPSNLAPFYPYPRNIYVFDAEYSIAGIVVLLISGGCLWMVKKMPVLPAVWIYYVITLLPVLGIVQAGHQAAADRFTYLPSASIFLLAGTGVLWVIGKILLMKRKVLFGGLFLMLIGTVVSALSYATIKQISTWQNSVSLWTHEISIFPESVSLPYCNLGNAYLDKGLFDEAIDAYKKALAIDSRDSTAHANAGVAYEKKGMLDAAISKYKDAIHVNANADLPHYNLGNLYKVKGMHEQAILEYKKALAINPSLFSAHNNLGQIYAEKGLFDEAILEYQRALSIDPRYTEAYINLGTTYLNKDMAHEAIIQFRNAIDLNPDDAKAHCNLGAAFLKNKMFDEAISECKKAIYLDPTYAKAYFNLGSAYGNKGMMDEAIAHFKQAIIIEPGYANAHYNLALVYYAQRNYKVSLEYLDKAKELGTRVDPKIDELLQAYR